jgi:hypothetical protein
MTMFRQHWFDRMTTLMQPGFNLLLLIGSALVFLAALRLVKLGHGRHWRLAVAASVCLVLGPTFGLLFDVLVLGLNYIGGRSVSPHLASSGLGFLLGTVLPLLRPLGLALAAFAILRHATLLLRHPATPPVRER